MKSPFLLLFVIVVTLLLVFFKFFLCKLFSFQTSTYPPKKEIKNTEKWNSRFISCKFIVKILKQWPLFGCPFITLILPMIRDLQLWKKNKKSHAEGFQVAAASTLSTNVNVKVLMLLNRYEQRFRNKHKVSFTTIPFPYSKKSEQIPT